MNKYNISDKLYSLVEKSFVDLKDIYETIDEVCLFNSNKVLESFQRNNVSDMHFYGTTGYGYDDSGRDVIEKVFADIFKAEDSLVRNQFISGTHALSTTLFGLLRPNDTMLSITGPLYDTMHKVIGVEENSSSLISFGVNYEEIDLINNDFDYEKILDRVKKGGLKLIYIQRSKGYSTRKSICIDLLEKVIDMIKKIDSNIIIMVDNCYCEFVTKKEPIEVGADIAVGSLIKNLGGGIAPNGAYVVGKANLIELVAERLNVPGMAKEIGPTLDINKSFLQGIYFAPSVVKSSLKTAVLTSYLLEKSGFDVEPRYDESRADIVQNIVFNDPERLVNYCRIIQNNSAINSFVSVEASPMPGYEDKIVMASGSFNQGSSIELSCDGPLRSPYIAYQQGSLTFEYGFLAIIRAIDKIVGMCDEE